MPKKAKRPSPSAVKPPLKAGLLRAFTAEIKKFWSQPAFTAVPNRATEFALIFFASIVTRNVSISSGIMRGRPSDLKNPELVGRFAHLYKKPDELGRKLKEIEELTTAFVLSVHKRYGAAAVIRFWNSTMEGLMHRKKVPFGSETGTVIPLETTQKQKDGDAEETPLNLGNEEQLLNLVDTANPEYQKGDEPTGRPEKMPQSHEPRPQPSRPRRDRSGYVQKNRLTQVGLHVLIDKEEREALNRLAANAGLSTLDFMRHLVKSAIAKGTDPDISKAIEEENRRAIEARQRVLSRIMPGSPKKATPQ